MKIKELVKWTDIALSLRELFSEVKNSLKDHDSKLSELQQQNISLLQELTHQKDQLNIMQNRIEFLEQKNMKGHSINEISKKIEPKKPSIAHKNE